MKICFKDVQLRNMLAKWLQEDNVVCKGEKNPVILVPDLRLGFVFVSLLRGNDPVLEVWDGLEKIPTTWEKHVVLFGDYRRVRTEIANMFPLLAVELFDGNVNVMHFKTKGQGAEYVALVVNRRRERVGADR